MCVFMYINMYVYIVMYRMRVTVVGLVCAEDLIDQYGRKLPPGLNSKPSTLNL